MRSASLPTKPKDRPVPFNEHSERLILGELLLNNESWERAKVLTDADFFLPGHKRIFACIKSRLERGRRIDLTLLADALKRQGELDSIGGWGYLCHLTEQTCKNVPLSEHLSLLREKTRLRALIGMAHAALTEAYSESDALETANRLSEGLAGLPESV